jgi:hypothetical protein
MDIKSNEEFYRSIEKVYCPYFKDYIYFNDVGLEHLRFKNSFTIRPTKDSVVRFNLMSKVVKILTISHTLQGISNRNRFENRFVNGRKEKALLFVKYYEFIAIIDTKKIKIIIKQTEGNPKIFLSVIPLYKEKTPLHESDGFS